MVLVFIYPDTNLNRAQRVLKPYKKVTRREVAQAQNANNGKRAKKLNPIPIMVKVENVTQRTQLLHRLKGSQVGFTRPLNQAA